MLWQSSRSAPYVINGTAPPPINLPEADVSDMEYYVSQAKIILPVLGVNLLRSVATATTAAQSPTEQGQISTDSPVFELNLKKEGVVARAREIDGEFTVLQGSHVRMEWIGTSNDGYKALRDKLLQEGTIAPGEDDGPLRFTHDSVFTSPGGKLT